MSCPCGCGSVNTCSSSCDPCAQSLTTQESVASQLQNLQLALFGTFTKTIVNGRAVWTSICSPLDNGLSCNPKNQGEGLICYFLRILDDIGIFFGGAWANNVSYCNHTFVTFNNVGYVSLQDVPSNKQPDLFPAFWQVVIQGTQGPAGPQGPPGAPGGGSPGSHAILTTSTDVTLSDTDDVVFCVSMGAPITVTLPQISGLTSGKFYEIWSDGSDNVTIAANGADNIQGNPSFLLDTANESVTMQSDATTNWRIT